jgi:hypothetical protein
VWFQWSCEQCLFLDRMMAQIYFRSAILPNFVLNINLFAKIKKVVGLKTKIQNHLNKKYKELLYHFNCFASKYNK